MKTPATRARERERAVAITGWLMLVVLLAPIAWTTIPPLSDYPNHLVRVHLLGKLAEGASVGPWSARWALLPNLAVDIAGVALEPLLGLEGFAKSFLASIVVLHVLGCRALSRAVLGRPSMRGVVASAFVWSEPLLLGYVSFAFGLGLAMLAIARVVAFLEKGARRDAAVAAALGLAVAVSHAAAAATLVAAALAFVGVRVARSRRVDQRAAVAAAALVPCCAVIATWWLRSASHGGVSLATPGMIARAAISTLTSLDAKADHLSLAVLAALVIAALYTQRPLEVRSGPLAAAAAVGLLVAVFPSDLAGGIEVHGRFALGLWTLAPFAVDARDGVEGPARRRLASVGRLVIALFVARTALLARDLRALDRDARDIRTLLARETAQGESLGVAWFFPRGDLAAADRVRALGTLHVPTLAILDREAEVPTLYDLPGVQPIHYEGALPRRHRYAADDPGPRAGDLLRAFRLVWVCGGPPDLAFELAGRASIAGRAGRCTLYRRSAVVDIASSAASIAPSSSATSSSAASCSAASLPRVVVSSMRVSTL